MHRSFSLLAVLAAPAALLAQASPASSAPTEIASLEATATIGAATGAGAATESSLPDAPSASLAESSSAEGGQAGLAVSAGKADTPVAPKYAGIILPGQTSIPLSAGDKVVYGFRSAFSLSSLVSSTVSAGYSHLVDSAPHYGRNSEAFGKREGVAALRSTVQNVATSAVFAPIFHDDPRYYELGPQHRFINRAIYAATRVVITRSDSGGNRLNAPLLLGYGAAAGLNNLYYPDQDTGAKASLTSYATSLGGAALGMEVNEFLDDALRIVHLRR